ncbi:mitochondrial ribosomal protein 10 [Polychaeton citri CBS 116435]|uniref:Small ribosomal subunit protein mS37 n=1 Tax=Polychaeton citri CBS 116435 TaxID=1314669 RepID=A0A9P4UTI5_9PEZI|nr:mitochondrial ribosomal protein 10 [Polychaeton citri CBS 116435]
MVAGKNQSQHALQRAASAPKLPPLPKLRVRRPDAASANPCLGAMSSVLGCWASQGYTTQGCAALEQQLRACMDARKPGDIKKNNINYHLSRMYPKIIGPHKRK